MSEIEQLRLENARLNNLIEQAHYVVSELIDGSRRQNAERCNAWEVKKALAQAVDKYYVNYHATRPNNASTGHAASG
jgi:hypothetical protein